MKVQSKKDEYIVKCENAEHVKSVMNFIEGDDYDEWNHWEYVIKSEKLKIGDCDFIENSIKNKYSHLPVISFEEWQGLPDFPKPEYDHKDVAFRQRKVVGYKLIKPEDKEAVREILKNGDSSWFDNFDSNLIESGYNFVFCDVLNSVHNQLETAGVMHWFSPVYDTSITLKSGVILSEDDIAEVKEILKNL